MNSIVTKRFVACVDYLKEQDQIRSMRQFAMNLDYLPQSLGEILKFKRDVTIELIRKAIEVYHLNPNYLFLGKGQLIQTASDSSIPTVVTNNEQEERIAYVPIAAQAGYHDHLHCPVYLQDLPTFALPGYRYAQGTHRCFDVSGDSMEPSLYGSDKIICTFVDPDMHYRGLRSNQVYVVVTMSGILVKRVVNNIRVNGTLELHSENSYYEPYIVDADQVQEVWKVEEVISQFMCSPNHERNGLYNELEILKSAMADQSDLISNLNRTIELLVKQNRLSRIA